MKRITFDDVRPEVRAVAMKEALNDHSCPPSLLRRTGYSIIEPGIRPVVEALVQAHALPIWSCEGHGWYGREVASLVWFRRAFWEEHIRGRPFVICAGPWGGLRNPRSATRAATALLRTGYGPLRVFFLRAQQKSLARRRVRWCRASRYFVLVFTDKNACRPWHDEKEINR